MTNKDETVQVILPDFCRWQVLLAAVLMAEIVLLSIEIVHQGVPIWPQLGINSLLITGFSLLLVFCLCLARNWLNDFEGNRAWWVSWLVIVVIGFIASWLGWILLQSFDYVLLDIPQLEFSIRTSAVVAMLSAMMLRYYYIQQLWQQENLSQTEARVQALQSRIRPHFLFNSLNSIAALIPENPLKAEQATEDLADLFRSALRGTRELSTLSDELAMVEKYLRIEQHRLGRRLQLSWQIDDLPGDALMPPLLLQPLVENAIAHGVEPRTEAGTVGISGACDGDYVVIVITSPLNQNGSTRDGNHMAVANIRERLHYHFSGRASLSLNPYNPELDTGHFQSILRFPYNAYSNS